MALSPLKSFSDLKVEEEKEQKKSISPKAINEEAIRSIAIVKNSLVEFPVSFHELQSNTDLKTPPSNWLRGQFSVYFPSVPIRKSHFTSFIMGYQFPDCIGEVDIVSDAENIKKLLKMAYKPNSHLSMMVHRVGKTILIDDFDIYKCLFSLSQFEWKWMKNFFHEHVLNTLAQKEENVLMRPNKSRDVVQSNHLLSKFLYYSIDDENIGFKESERDNLSKDDNNGDSSKQISSAMNEESGGVMAASPESKETSAGGSSSLMQSILDVEEPPCGVGSTQPFTRNVIWNFEDLRMLIGTDLPIFGGRTHPCVSLRLSDMNKPINILTGIDYWLDNLMCNVPEVVMCYHEDGIVQKYELVKTEDLPNLTDSPFSPQLVRDIAHNILSFLKSKATKEGHTYWLFKAKGDDIVKLYDLTSVYREDDCNKSEWTQAMSDEAAAAAAAEGSGANADCDPDATTDEAGNPFTEPVALLLYCVAKNLWACKDSDDGDSNKATICSLLKKALSLIKKEKYPKIFCHAHLIMADLFLPQEVDPDEPVLPSAANETSTRAKRKKEKAKMDTSAKSGRMRHCSSVHLDALCRKYTRKANKHKQSGDAPPLNSDVSLRCASALDHVITALSFMVLQRPSEGTTSDSASSHTDKKQKHPEPRTARPFEPIPMGYEPISKKAKDKSNPKAAKNSDHHSSALCNWVQSCKSGGVVARADEERSAVLAAHLSGVSWEGKVRFRLLRKAALVFMTRGRISLEECRFGLCLRYAKLALNTWCAMLDIFGSAAEFPLPSQPLVLAGDSYFQIASRWSDSYVDQFNAITTQQKAMNELLTKMLPNKDNRWTIEAPRDTSDSLRKSQKIFEAAVTNAPTDVNVKRRYASVCNEIGCSLLAQDDVLTGECLTNLEKACKIFEEVCDGENEALLRCNLSKYLRVHAWHLADKHGGVPVHSALVKNSFEKSFREYESALTALSSSVKSSVGVTSIEEFMKKVTLDGLNVVSVQQAYKRVIREYATSLYGYGLILKASLDTPEQRANCDVDTLHKDAISTFSNCIRISHMANLCNPEPMIQLRCAQSQLKLAQIYQSKFKQTSDTKASSLAETHYQKAVSELSLINSIPAKVLKCYIEYVEFLEELNTVQKNPVAKWKRCLSILSLLVKCSSAVAIAHEMREAESGARRRQSEQKDELIESPEDAEATLDYLQRKLNSTLLATLRMVKTCDKNISIYESDFKEMYGLSLNTAKKSVAAHLLQALSAISVIVDKINAKFDKK